MAGVIVHEGDQHQIEPHAEVCKGQVAHEEPGDAQLVVADEEDDEDGEVSKDGEHRDDPGEAAQEGEAQQVLTGVEGVRLWSARDEGAAEAIKLQVWILKVDLVNETRGIIGGLSEKYTRVTFNKL